MNRIILEENECEPQGGRISLDNGDRRTQHIRGVLHARPGDTLRVGRLNGFAGLPGLTSPRPSPGST